MSVRPGEVFGRLTVLQALPDQRAECACSCGVRSVVRAGDLRSGNTRSCGCLSRDTTTNRSTKHGYYGSPTYLSWYAMKQRCLNPNWREYPRYGGRGIRVCDRWLAFEGFLADMGERPPGTSIDRIDPNGHYEPGNCRWATKAVQANNCRANRRITVGDETRTAAMWARHTGVPASAIIKRLRRGWEPSRAVSTPLQSR